MSDIWLPYEERHARWDDPAEQLVIVGWRPGPAGVASFDVTPTLRLVVDHASPTTLTELLVHAPGGRMGPGDTRVLRHLLGDEVVAMLPHQPNSPPERPTRLVTRDRFTRYDDMPTDRARRLARLVLAADLADDDDQRPAVRAIARFEAATIAIEPDAIVPLDHARVLAARAFDDLSRLPAGALAGAAADHDLRSQVMAARGYLDAFGPRDANFRRAADRLRDLLESFRDHRPAAASLEYTADAPGIRPAAPAAPPRAAASGGLMARRQRDKADAAQQPAPIEVDGSAFAWIDEGGNVRVRARLSDEGSWARVFRRRGELLLALAPLRRDGDQPDRAGAEAVVVIPSGVAPHELVVDITSAPEQRRPSATAVAVRHAVAEGRRAARLRRLREPAAREAWLSCRDAWREVDDVQRANLAARYASDTSSRPTSARGLTPAEALLADAAVDW